MGESGTKMARCIFENLTPAQAKRLAEWYEGQGEQDAEIWFDDIPTPMTDVQRPGGYMEELENGDIIVYCKEA